MTFFLIFTDIKKLFNVDYLIFLEYILSSNNQLAVNLHLGKKRFYTQLCWISATQAASGKREDEIKIIFDVSLPAKLFKAV